MRKAVAFLAIAALAACGGDATAEQDAATPQAIVNGWVADLAPADLEQLRDAGEIRLIDVRTDEEVAEGIIPGAEHIMLDDLDMNALAPDAERIVFYCRSGRRSALAAEQLAQVSGKTQRHLGGGILAWQEAGMDIAQPSQPEGQATK